MKKIDPKTTWRTWVKLTRPHTLTAGFVPVFIGTVLAITEGHFNLGMFLAMLFATLLIQAATNMFNEYYDYKRGLDTEKSVGIGGTIVRDGVDPKTIMKIALGCYAVALIIGVFICVSTTWVLAIVGLISMAFGFIYTGGPIPIAYTPFGELTAGFFMGFEIIAISYFIQTGYVTWEVFIITIPASFLIANILMANNIRDFDNDKLSGRKTLAILAGKKGARTLHKLMFAGAYGFALIMPFFGIANFGTWLCLLSLPVALKAVKGFVNCTDEPISMMPAMVDTAKTNSIFGFFYGLGILAVNFISNSL